MVTAKASSRKLRGTRAPAPPWWAGRRRVPLLVLLGLAAGVVWAGCSADSTPSPPGDAGVDGRCPAGLLPYQTACLPRLDDCAASQVPIPGGGCKTVGIEECPAGLEGAADTTCKRIGPTASCSAGWTAADKGWCAPSLAPGPCPQGTMPALGQTTCVTVGACGSGTWGAIVTDSKTLFVDQSYSSGNSDGSQAKPFTTIGAALAAASAGAKIAVAAGTYAEDVAIGTQVTLEGRCPEKVLIQGQGTAPYAAVEIRGTKATVKGLRVTGPKLGVGAEQAEVTLEQLVVEQCGCFAKLDDSCMGIGVQGGTTLTLRDSLLDSNEGLGLAVVDSRVTLERTTVRNTRPQQFNKRSGAGVLVSRDKAPSSLTLSDSVLRGNRAAGVYSYGGAVVISRSVIQTTGYRESDRRGGYGILAERGVAAADLKITDSLVSESTQAGISISGSTATIERTVVLGTRAPPEDQPGGFGVAAYYSDGPSKVQLRDAVLADNRFAGINVSGSAATLDRCVIRGTTPYASSSPFGIGLLTGNHDKARTSVTLRDSVVADSIFAGVAVVGAVVTLERTTVRDTDSGTATGLAGEGIWVNSSKGQRGVLTMKQSAVERSRTSGILILDSDATLDRSVVRETRPDKQGEKISTGISVNAAEARPTLDARDSLVTGSVTTGVSLFGGSAKLQRCVIRNSKNVGGSYGDGVQVMHDLGAKMTTLTLTDSLVEQYRRAGALFLAAGGAVSSSVLRGGVFSIVLDEGASPTIAQDNVMEGNKENKVTYGTTLKPAPTPKVPPPP